MLNLVDRLAPLVKRILPWRGKRNTLSFNDLFVRFHQILEENNKAMELIAEMEDKLGGQYVFDKKFLEDMVAEIERVVLRSAYNFNFITNNKELEIYNVIESLARTLQQELAGNLVIPSGQNVLALTDIQEAMEEAVGNKVYNLFRTNALPLANVPSSFVVTIGGFQKYLAFNNLFDKIDTLLQEVKQGAHPVESASQSIRLQVLNGDIPSDLRHEILRAAEKLCPKNPETSYYSVRSSGVGEDGVMSFAGLHDSFLNVPFRELLSSYKKVLAGMYNPACIEYRLQRQIPFSDMAMAVLYQEMVPCRTAGVVYTVDPNSPDEQVCLVGAGWGLGKVVVEGGASDMFKVSRNPPYEVLESRIGEKKWMVVPYETGESARVDEDKKNQPCLDEKQAAAIVEMALMIERYFKRPLDIEWCLDADGRIWILQARPLGIARGDRARSPELKEILKHREILMQDQGIIAYRGVGSGPVCLVDGKRSLERFPSGAVLVARYGIPLLAQAIPRASAVVTDVGSPTGHMATVAREFRIPTIVDTGSATEVLQNGQEITVDAERNVIYEGRVNELLHHELFERPLFETLHEFQVLRRLLRRIAPLTLIDPDDPNFTARGCKTFHDVIRFIHEKSIQALLQIAETPSTLLAHGGKRLKANVPLNLILIDIGGGLTEGIGKGGWVVPEQISSMPMQALWSGMGQPDSWNTEPVVADFKGLMSGVTRTQTATVAGQVLTGLNVAVLGANYMNLTLRVGYHFTVVDARMGPEQEKNVIFFRFVGGATDISRRSRRATLLLSILEKIGFKVEGSGDLVIARLTNSNMEQMEKHLYLVGRLIGFVRQLDVLMTDDTTVDLYFQQFMKANDIDTAGDYEIERSKSDDNQIDNLHS